MNRKEAIEYIRWYFTEDDGIAADAKVKEAIQALVPELTESEDERIRKTIVTIVEQYARVCEKEGDPCEASLINDALAYLEKQKEQKPAEINVKALLAADRLASAEMTGRLKERSEILENPEKYGLHKPAEWSEEDENIRHDIIARLESLLKYETQYIAKACLQKEISWLKSLLGRPKPSDNWKPTKEQLEALNALNCHGDLTYIGQQKELISLYHDLEKL